LVEDAAFNIYDILALLWGFGEWFWIEAFWKTTIVVADWI
jgi:hypothetical protein